jgi:hypothetical protein
MLQLSSLDTGKNDFLEQRNYLVKKYMSQVPEMLHDKKRFNFCLIILIFFHLFFLLFFKKKTETKVFINVSLLYVCKKFKRCF